MKVIYVLSMLGSCAFSEQYFYLTTDKGTVDSPLLKPRELVGDSRDGLSWGREMNRVPPVIAEHKRYGGLPKVVAFDK